MMQIHTGFELHMINAECVLVGAVLGVRRRQ